MRILVISDSHGSLANLEKVLDMHPEAEHVIFLGDGVREAEEASFIYDNMQFHLVAGNCDFGSSYPSTAVTEIAGKRILYTHGHTMNVKYGYNAAIERAKAEGADILLFGHTHEAAVRYCDGLYLMNPGSVSRPRGSYYGSYGYIDIVYGGVMTAVVELKPRID